MNWSRQDTTQHDYHVMEFYIHQAVVLQQARYLAHKAITFHRHYSGNDFDIETERREGWAYET